MTPVHTRPASSLTAAARLGVATVGCAAIGVGVARLPLATLPWSDPAALRTWFADSETLDLTTGVLVALTTLLAAYLTVVFAVGALAVVVRARPLLQITDALTGGLVARLAAGSLTAGLGVATLASGPAGAALPRGAPSPPTMVVVDTIDTIDTVAGVESAAPPPTMIIVDPPAPSRPVEQAESAVMPDVAVTAVRPATWTVQRGEHLWSIVESDLTARLGRGPTDTEVAAHWDALIELNRHTLVDPANTDLLFAGQVLHLPPTR